MTYKLIEAITGSQLKPEVTTFHVGDTVVVDVKIVEGEKSRIQKFK